MSLNTNIHTTPFNNIVFHLSVSVFYILGLTLELYIEQDEYIPELTENAGVRVTIHDQEKMPFPEDDGLLVSADSMTMLGLTLVR